MRHRGDGHGDDDISIGGLEMNKKEKYKIARFVFNVVFYFTMMCNIAAVTFLVARSGTVGVAMFWLYVSTTVLVAEQVFFLFFDSEEKGGRGV